MWELVNHASSRQVQWTQGKKVVFLRTRPIKALGVLSPSESIPSHFSAPISCIVITSPHFRHGPWEVRFTCIFRIK